MAEPKIDEKLAKTLNSIFGWSQSIRREAIRSKEDGIDDSALIIQEVIEEYLREDCGVEPSDVIAYKKFGIQKPKAF